MTFYQRKQKNKKNVNVPYFSFSESRKVGVFTPVEAIVWEGACMFWMLAVIFHDFSLLCSWSPGVFITPDMKLKCFDNKRENKLCCPGHFRHHTAAWVWPAGALAPSAAANLNEIHSPVALLSLSPPSLSPRARPRTHAPREGFGGSRAPQPTQLIMHRAEVKSRALCAAQSWSWPPLGRRLVTGAAAQVPSDEDVGPNQELLDRSS